MKLLENAQQLPLADMEKSSEQQEAKGSYRRDKRGLERLQRERGKRRKRAMC